MPRSQNCTLELCLPDGVGRAGLQGIPVDDEPDGLWFYHTVNARSHFDRRYRHGEFIPHHSRVLKENLRWRTYAKTVTATLRAGWVETDGRWEKGVKSIGFRPSPPLRERRHRFVEVDCPRLARQQARRRARKDEQLTTGHKYLRRMLDDLTLTPDAPTVGFPMVYLAHRKLWFEVCRQGRVHTNLTALDRTLRRFVRWRDLPLWQTDIGCCQALILGLVYEQAAGLRDKRLRTGRTCDFLTDCLGRGDDGLDLHGVMARRLGVTRADAKEAYWLLAFGSRDDMRPSGRNLQDMDHPKERPIVWGAYVRAFSEGYPRVYDWLWAIKPESSHPDFRELKGDLAREMQRLESELMIAGVCEDIRHRYPGACVLTLHDCLISTQDYLPAFKEIIAEHFWREHRVRPVMKDEPFGG